MSKENERQEVPTPRKRKMRKDKTYGTFAMDGLELTAIIVLVPVMTIAFIALLFIGITQGAITAEAAKSTSADEAIFNIESKTDGKMNSINDESIFFDEWNNEPLQRVFPSEWNTKLEIPLESIIVNGDDITYIALDGTTQTASAGNISSFYNFARESPIPLGLG